MNKDELPEYVKELIHRAIATRLKISKEQLMTSSEAKAKVDRCLMTVKAIADNRTPTLDSAVNDLLAIHSMRGEVVSRRLIQREVNECYDTFNTEIAGIESMSEMNRKNMEPKVIWDFLRSRVPIGSEYEDDWLQDVDAWILRGEKSDRVLGTAKICSFPNPEDEEAFVREIIEMKTAKHRNPNA